MITLLRGWLHVGFQTGLKILFHAGLKKPFGLHVRFHTGVRSEKLSCVPIISRRFEIHFDRTEVKFL